MNWRRPYIPPGPMAAALHAICDGIQMCQINYAPGGIVTRTSRGTTIRPIGQPTGLAGGAVLEASITELHDDYYVGTIEDGSTINIAKPQFLRASLYRPGWTLGNQAGLGRMELHPPLVNFDGLSETYLYAYKLINALCRFRIVRPVSAFGDGPTNIRSQFDSWLAEIDTQIGTVKNTDDDTIHVAQRELRPGSSGLTIDYAFAQEVVYPFFPLTPGFVHHPEGIANQVLSEPSIYCLPVVRVFDVPSDSYQRSAQFSSPGFSDFPPDAFVACTHIDLNLDARQWVDVSLIDGRTIFQPQRWDANQRFGNSNPVWFPGYSADAPVPSA